MNDRPLQTSHTTEGLDTDLAWNDRHFQYIWLWLLHNPLSPYKGSPAMILTAMDVDRYYWKQVKKGFNTGKLIIRFSVRIRLTTKLKAIVNGMVNPRVDKIDKLKRVIKYTILPSQDPRPLPIPPWIKGSVKVTTKGLQLSLRGAAQTYSQRHAVEGAARLTNPFGKV